jgi:hypothetical protein
MGIELLKASERSAKYMYDEWGTTELLWKMRIRVTTEYMDGSDVGVVGCLY